MGLQAVDFHNDVGILPLVVGIIAVCLATAVVILRFYSHKITGASHGLDDLWIVVALVSIFIVIRSFLFSLNPVHRFSYGAAFAAIFLV